LEAFSRKYQTANGYVEVRTHQLVDRTLWVASGHWEKFRENMFVVEDENRAMALKPMNCPCHVQIFKQGITSYRDLPLRMAEFG
ncbi:aminoacyl--tRNA ligase-related protein, partial [Acinetobacter baumannii]